MKKNNAREVIICVSGHLSNIIISKKQHTRVYNNRIIHRVLIGRRMAANDRVR